MSSSLVYRIPQSANSLSDELKYKLQDAYQLPYLFTEGDISFLKGLHVCGIEDADKLIKLIEKHSVIEIRLEY